MVVFQLQGKEDLTWDNIRILLQEHYPEWRIPTEKVPDISICRNPVGALSQVWNVTILSKDDKTNHDIAWIAKFPHLHTPTPTSTSTDKTDDEFFRVESAFYQYFFQDHPELQQQQQEEAQHQPLSSSFPFHVPKSIYTSSSCILLERIPNITTYTLLQGCPTCHILPILSSLATMHAQYWQSSSSSSSIILSQTTTTIPMNLSSHPGIGSKINGLIKEQIFSSQIQHWYHFSNIHNNNNNNNNPQLLSKFQSIAKQLQQRKLRYLHTMVEQFQPTLIHGDFHVANLLFPNHNHHDDDNNNTTTTTTNNNNNNYKYYLIDWATCGKGNPLKDFIFFQLLSIHNEDHQQKQQQHQQQQEYYDHLKYLRHYHHSIQNNGVTWSWEHCLEMYHLVLLNQLCILVAYHSFATDMAKDNIPLTQHFQNVNRRCINAIVSSFEQLQSIITNKLPLKSTQDYDEEQKALPTIQISL